jgi:hypothetical protein
MNICCANHGPRLAAPTSNNVKFSNNPQDHDVLPNDTVDIPGVNANGGKPQTDHVALENKKGIFVMGQMVGLRPDPGYKLTPNADGNFVYADNSDKNFNGANAFGAVAETVNKYNEVLGELGAGQIEWAFNKPQLKVSPETGEYPNAFYSRQFEGLHFFHYKTTSTAASGEVASHEAGHAILDARRPGYMEGSGAETGAFHEAFGDTTGMLLTLGNEKAVEALVAQTGGTGDLSTGRNLLADVGEAFGHALGREGGIRTAKNDFVYADPATLPEHGDENHLGREVHDFSRLWSGAFYDVLDGISDANREAGMTPKEALMSAGAEAWKLMVGGVELSPKSSETTFHEMANHLMSADAQFNGGNRADVIKNVMVKRGLMDADAAPPAQPGARLFNAEPVKQQFTFGADAGQLAGVKMTATVDSPAFGLVGLTNSTITEAEKGARLMAQDGNVLFTDKQNPDMGDFFRPDGTAYSAYVAPNANGEKEFRRTHIAF